MIINKVKASSSNWQTGTRLTSTKWMSTNNSVAENSDSSWTWDFMNGVRNVTPSSTTILNYFFRRAPGFFDVVAYTGTGSNQTVSHNLGVAPELLIVKSRSDNDEWIIYSNALTSGYSLYLPSVAAETLFTNAWQSPAVDSTNFYLGTHVLTNRSSGSFIAYMFATVPGISKVGSYNGTGSAQDINCGFTSGARFVLIKASKNRNGDWYLWDSERGIVAGNDPYLLLNSAVAQATTTDYIDPLSSGFTITSSAPVALNASDGEYIFLAIA
jgi:hypothetical protein